MQTNIQVDPGFNDSALPVGALSPKQEISSSDLKRIAATLINKSIKTSKQSHHHTFKVGSTVYTQSGDDKERYASFANKIPRTLRNHKEYGDNFKPNDPEVHKIGDGHPTVHGEFRVLYTAAPPSDHVLLGCNTPLCANCMMTAIMRGVDAIVVDEASLPGNERGPGKETNPWSDKREKLWYDLCLELARAAKIPVYSVKDSTDPLSLKKKIDTSHVSLDTIVHGVPPEQRPAPQFPAHIFTKEEFLKILDEKPEKFLSKKNNERRIIAAATDDCGNQFFIYTKDSHPPGFGKKAGKKMTDRFKDAHYKFTLDPLIHAAMEASKHGLKLRDGRIAANFIPDAARQLELAYVGIEHVMYREDHLEDPRSDGKEAMATLSEMGLIEYSAVSPETAMNKLLKDDTPPSLYHDPQMQ